MIVADMRIYQAKKNIFFSFLLKIYQLLIPFVMRTMVLYMLGVEYLGLNSLFGSVLGVLSLAELGISNAIVFKMYRAVAENDQKLLQALVEFYKRCYRVIGGIIFCVGLLVIPFLKFLIKGEGPESINIYYVYLINLAAACLSYFLFAYKGAILVANQKNDIVSVIGIISKTILFVMQVVVLLFSRSYYWYLLCAPMAVIITNLLQMYVVDKRYPLEDSVAYLGKSDREEIYRKVKALVTMKLGQVILASSDNIIISAFLGVAVLGVFSNYLYITTALIGVVGMVSASIVPILGHSLITEDTEKNYDIFMKLSFMNLYFLGWFSTMLLCLYQPFIQLWIGEKYLLDIKIVVLLVLYLYILQSNQILGAYKDAAGIWEKDKYRPLLVSLCNLSLNLILVQFIGIYGVVLSTIISLIFVNTPWIIVNVNTLVFNCSCRNYLKLFLKQTFFFVLVGYITFGITSKISCPSEITNILVIFSASFIISGCLYYIFNFNDPLLKQSTKMLNRALVLRR